MRIAVPRETAPGENRVALVPDTVTRLAKAGFDMQVETGAGIAAGFKDEAYAEAGATIAAGAGPMLAAADVVLKVREPMADAGRGHEVDLLRQGSALLAFLGRDRDSELACRLTARGIRSFSMDLIPRISRAQKMDALSSMSTAAGYKAALLAAGALGKFFPLLMTAAGTIAPARVFVIGAGVAGLQAIATARRLGAVVEAFDVRPAVREEVQSLGATFVAPDLVAEAAVDKGGYAKSLSEEQQAREHQLLEARVKLNDVVITTAMIPGKRAPLLITAGMVQQMRPGSVIVDLAAEAGGNCELTRPGETVVQHGVTILGLLNLPASLPTHASQMYSRNISALLLHLVKDGKLEPDFEDEITRESCLTRGTRSPEMAAAGSGT
ncbi:MAG TPA: Re/Si-specific NAD(P)(+) transhydrogenase subunit alpha [Candidatus Eisenbacteria bacterium]|jgi:NAD(P) transhydrogenase subunit alpha